MMAKMTSPKRPARRKSRESLMAEHAAACARRDAAALGSAEFQAAAEDVARIEVEIATLEEAGLK
jgi:hypothetical protein